MPRVKKIVQCACCGKEGALEARGLIKSCYRVHRLQGTLGGFPTVINLTGDPQCTHVSQDGVRCLNIRAVDRKGHYKGSICEFHQKRRQHGKDMDAPKQYNRLVVPCRQCIHWAKMGGRCYVLGINTDADFGCVLAEPIPMELTNGCD